jgi:hypothetical protein
MPHRVTVRLKDGRRFERLVQHMKGGLGDPFTPEDRRAKFGMCCAEVLPPDRLEAVQDHAGRAHGRDRARPDA